MKVDMVDVPIHTEKHISGILNYATNWGYSVQCSKFIVTEWWGMAA